MFKKLKKYLNIVLGSTFLFFIGINKVIASAPGSTPGGSPGGTPGSIGQLNNPLGNINTFPSFIRKALEVIVQVGAPIVVLLIIYSGFMFVIARGNPVKLEKAKLSFGWTIVGAAILLSAWTLATIIDSTIKQIGAS